ncbi:HAD family hydrolase [Natronoflexus pectinivorans]|uniref:Putative hydrolase of the HAD superfamily n=1 Tax=Natronoflexus pectinivorans TaxID=682526 RepID=A0A4V2RWZ6_9BACT|nr:HAD family phosphatase [Natronoflexus pectinivorans]TCO10841.1 putative hydrolase of the HAD superfamily [Natronoflexus pectinivorans]
MKILNIIFDLGGVIIDLDVERTYKTFKNYISDKYLELEYGYIKHPVFRQYETGAISDDEFIGTLVNLAGNEITAQQAVDAWNAMLVQIPDERIRLLESLKSDYRLFILSNTNEIHTQKFESMANGYNKLSDLFESAWYSHLIGSRKPERQAFQTLIDRCNILPEETLFVDDLENNISTARDMGFQTLHVTRGLNIVEWFKDNPL